MGGRVFLCLRVFKSYDDLVDHCCEAWNELVDPPWRIMSIGLRKWPHGFSSMGLGIRLVAQAAAIGRASIRNSGAIHAGSPQ
jgi:hypothetical protein